MKGRRASQGFYPLPVWKTEEEPSETQHSRKVQTQQHTQTGTGTPKGGDKQSSIVCAKRNTESSTVVQPRRATSSGQLQQTGHPFGEVLVWVPAREDRWWERRRCPCHVGGTITVTALHQRSRVHAGSSDPADDGEPPPPGQRPC